MGLDKKARGYLRRIARIPDDLRKPERRSAAIRLLACLLCVAILLAGGIYTAWWMYNRDRILRESERYSQLYVPAAPSPSNAAPTATDAPLPQVDDVPLTTPNSDTLVLTLETPPPVQESFDALLAENAETVGFLEVGKIVSLPVVQRENDNNYYLNHNFSGAESSEGTLFLDGMNRLVPEDDCLIVYGHNMHNGTMFGNLHMYLNLDYFRSSGTVIFDTLYENRQYVPFAAFNASMTPENSAYFDVRQFVFDETTFELFVLKLQSRSEYDVPVDVRYGDKLLLLVTCDYTRDDGRFILALRALRDGESPSEMNALLAQTR